MSMLTRTISYLYSRWADRVDSLQARRVLQKSRRLPNPFDQGRHTGDVVNNFESGKIASWNDSHPSLSTMLSITPSVAIMCWARHLWWANPAEWWKFKNAAIVAMFAGMILVPLMSSRLRRKYALFRAIVIWVAIALIAYTLLSAVWGENFRAGWEGVEFSNFRDRLSSVFTAIGGIGAVGYLVIKYRQQAGSERELSRLIVREADDKLMQAVQQLSSHSAQARLAGVYALSEIADVYGSEAYVTDYNKRVVDILCGYLRTKRPKNDGPVESVVVSVLNDHLSEQSIAYDGSINVSPGPWSEYSIDLRRSKFREPFRLHDAIISDLKLQHSTFIDQVELSGVVFSEGVNFDSVQFCDLVVFKGVKFNAETKFQSTVFEKDVTFETGQTGGQNIFKFVDFKGVKFKGRTIFQDVVFDEVTRFKSDSRGVPTTFADLTFRRATLKSITSFSSVKFSGETEFSRTFFEGPTSFDIDETCAPVDFMNVTFRDVSFKSSTAFKNTLFAGSVEFDSVSIGNNSSFHRVELRNVSFNKPAIFRKTVFDGLTTFKNVEFQDATEFSSVHFKGSLHIGPDQGKNTKFNAPKFYKVTFDKDVTFDAAYFKGEVEFKKGIFEDVVNFGRRGRVQSRATREVGVRFDGNGSPHTTVFKEGVLFREMKFKNSAYFEGVQFHGDTDFCDVEFEKDAEFSSHSKVSKTMFSKVRFIDTTFRGESSFRHVTMRDAYFMGVDFSDANFNNCSIERISFSGSMLRGTSFSRLSIKGARLGNIAFFSGTKCDGVADFSYAKFEIEADFSACNFSEVALFRGAIFKIQHDGGNPFVFGSGIQITSSGIPRGARWVKFSDLGLDGPGKPRQIHSSE